MKKVRIMMLILGLLVALAAITACAMPTTAPAPAATTKAPEATKAPAATSAPVAGQPVKGGTLTVSQGVNCADTLNQHVSINTGCRMIAHHVLDTLVVVNPKDGAITPSLATSWEVSADGKVYTFKLRKDIKFQDGTAFNAQAVKYNFDYTVRPDIKHGFAYGAMGGERYEKSEVVDESTVKIYFKSPHPTFLINLSDGGLGIDSPTAMDKAGADYGIKTLVGTGPFKFKEWVKDDHITLVPADQYPWGPTIYKHTGAPYLNELIYRDVTDASTRAAALEAGEIQLISMVESQVAPFKNNKDIAILTTPKAGTARMYMMNNAKPPTDDLKVRQAISHAIDKKTLIQLPAWSGFGNPGIAPLPSNMMPANVLAEVKKYDYPFDVAKANALLDEAGWKMGSDGIREKGGQKLTIQALAIAPTEIGNMEPVDQMLRKVGIKMNISTGDFNWLVATRVKGDFNIALSSDSGYDSLRLVNYFFHTKSPSNVYGFNKADALIEKAQNALTEKDLWDNITLAQVEILKNAVGVMGWEQVYIYGTRANVREVFFNEVGYPFYYDTWIEKK
jgi:peptide/nickel transport system substrate-binding protein